MLYFQKPANLAIYILHVVVKLPRSSLFRVMEGSKIFTRRFTRIRNSFGERNAEFVFSGGSVFYINRREEKYLIRTSNSVRAAFMHTALLDHSHYVMQKIAVPRRKGERRVLETVTNCQEVQNL